MKLLSHVQLFVIPWTVAYQAPPSMEFSRQEYWSGLPIPSPGDIPDPGIEPRSPALQADTLPSEPPGKTVFKFYVKRNLFKKRYKEYSSTHFRTVTSRTVISKLDRDIIHKIMLVNYNTPIVFRRQGLSPKHCTGYTDQDHPHGKEMQKSKMAVWGSLTNSCEKKRSKKPRRKGKI